MAKDYLLEVGMEEIPARFLLDLRDQLAQRASDFLKENRISFGEIKTFATPRRLALIISNLDEKQEDISEKAKGPALRIAQDQEGNWTKAAQGFARGQGVSVDDIYTESFKGEEYIFVDKFIPGQAIATILESFDQVLDSMTFPISMTWHDYSKSYIRPIHWIVSLLDDKVIPFNFINIEAGQESQGHRFLGQPVVIKDVASYQAALREEFVIVDFEERMSVIEQQINTIAQDNNWLVPIDSDLLEEVTAIVEWPTAFFGKFEEEYLQVPSNVLITAMKDHQRYFYAQNPETKALLPVFISVRNGNADHIENVIKGNKKVLRARLEDALFFYQEDKKENIDFYLNKLSNVKEHYKLGSLSDKQERVEKITQTLGQILGQNQAGEIASQAAAIYKFDLMTAVVNEFDELQGQMGELYAREYGVQEEIAQAIGEQYLPSSAGGQLPQTEAGAILAVSDKLDTLLNYFSIDLIPTGSNDPYALRRQAMGIVEIINDRSWDLELATLIEAAMAINGMDQAGVASELDSFIKSRVHQLLERLDIDYDIIEAVLDGRSSNVKTIIDFAQELNQFKDKQAQNYRQMVESLSRVVNLGIKEEDSTEIDPTLAETESEKELIAYIQEKLTEDADNKLELLANLSQPIDNYFENNMVNSDQADIKTNRLATIKAITDFVIELVDPRELISKF